MYKVLKAVLIALIFSAVIFTGCKTNKAPDKPSTPAGPTSGSKNTEYTFASTAEDPDDDDVAIRFAWGDGDTSDWSNWQASEDSISMFHSWSDSGSYTIRAQAKDLKEAVSSWSGSHNIIISTHIANNPPNTPITPTGDSIGLTNVSHSFISTATDPDGDSISIRFNWGDGDTSAWSDWKAGGDSISMTHTWSDTGTFNIKAQAKDKKDTTSGWSTGHSIKISGGGWIKTIGGPANDYGCSVQPTTDGGYIIVGSTNSFGHGQADVYLIKTDSLGDTMWTNTFGSTANDSGYSVQQTTDGGYIITGTYQSSTRGLDICLIKTDSSGNQTWFKGFGGSDIDVGNSVQQTTDGGYIIAGYTFSYGAGLRDVYLIKTDANGDPIWSKTFGGSDWEQGLSVQQTADGGYIITGYIKSYGASYRDVYLIKTDADGDSIWTKTFGGTQYDIGYSVQQTTDGGYIITGYSKSSSAGGSDLYLIKTDANGNKLWEKLFGGSSDDEGNSIVRHYNSYIITGYTQSYGAGGTDVYLIKTDANGNVK